MTTRYNVTIRQSNPCKNVPYFDNTLIAFPFVLSGRLFFLILPIFSKPFIHKIKEGVTIDQTLNFIQ